MHLLSYYNAYNVCLLTSIFIQRLVDHYEPIEDPSPVSFARKMSTLGQAEGLLSYKSTVDRITTSKCTFARWDIDPSLLSLLEVMNFIVFDLKKL